MAGEIAPPPITTAPRPMTIVEKIIASHAIRDAKTGALRRAGGRSRRCALHPHDVRFSHEYVTPMADALFVAALGESAKVIEPESVFTFRDHSPSSAA